MKRFYFLISFIIIATFTSSLLAQQKTFIERVKLEVSGGYSIPVSPTRNGASLSDFAGFRNFMVGANYELSNVAGLRFSYGNHMFEDSNNSSMGVTHHKLMAEGTFNILEYINKTRDPFEVIAHVGAGLSLGKSKLSSDIDKMSTLQIGLMPQYRITNNFSIHLDAIYVVNFKQDYFYDGGPASVDNKQQTGGYMMLNLGLGYSF
ncbi:MAG: hypothetical protein GX762_07340 [Bacteroidales bacterium]|nr:hypothetical protein [Bacteroidales bacterium]